MMPFFFRHLNLRHKLICFFILPLFIIVGVSVFHIHKQMKDYQYASRDILAINITKQTSLLINALQNERAALLNNQDSANPDNKYLQQTFKNTDFYIHAFESSSALSKIISKYQTSLNDEVNLKKYINKLDTYGNSINYSRKQILISNNESFFSFYNNYLENLFSLIHQLQIQNRNIEESIDYNELLHFLTIAELSSKEQLYISRIFKTGVVDLKRYNQIFDIIDKQKFEITQEAHALSPQYVVLLENLLESHYQTYESAIKAITEQLKLNSDARRIRYHLSYVSLLKNLKTENTPLVGELKKHKTTINKIIGDMESNASKTALQKQALISLKAHLHQFDFPDKNTINADLDIALSESLDILQKQVFSISEKHWYQTSNHRLEKINGIIQVVIGNIEVLSHKQQKTALHVIGIYLGGTFVLLTLSYLLGYAIIQGFTKNIKIIADAMNLMTRSPNLKLKIQISGDDETAQIAQSLNLMLEEKQKSQKLLNQAYVVFESSAEGILITNAENCIELVNPAFTTMTGYSLDELKGKKPSILGSERHQDYFFSMIWKELLKMGSWSGEIYNKDKQGKVYPVHLTIKLVKNQEGKITHHIGLYSDISSKKQYEKEIWKQANFDKVTELPNRHFFRYRLRQDLLIAQHNNWSLGLILIDLDGFKYINDTLSHSVGDRLLQKVGKRISKVLNKSQFIARFGGDEFIILIPKLESHQDIETLAKTIKFVFETPFKVNKQEIVMAASIGVAIYPYHGCDAESLSRNIEAAMFKAKEKGRNNITYYDPSLNQSLLKRTIVEQQLRKALLQQEFTMYYQPIFDITSKKIVAAEALIRWNNPELGFVAPDNFISLAEETGLIIPIGHWIVEQVMKDLSSLQEKGINISLSLNVSSRQFAPNGEENFVSFLETSINKHQVNPQNIHIEITESLLIEDNLSNHARLTQIRELGCEIYLDDFGTGYSSLSYLRKFPISVIKIDKSFLDHVLTIEHDSSLVKAIINMGKSLKMPLVAEGVETKEQLDFLKQEGCTYIQGYLISKPICHSDLCQFVKTFNEKQKSDA